METNVMSEMLKILYYMNEMECEELSMKTKDQEMTVLLTDCEENDNIESGQECAKSIPPEVGAQAGDSIIPAFLKATPPYSFVEWQTKTGLWHTNMLEDIDEPMIQNMPENPKIQYDTHTNTLTIRR